MKYNYGALCRGENPEEKFWSYRMRGGHRASNPIPEKNKILL
jgi:hypothetical protein